MDSWTHVLLDRRCSVRCSTLKMTFLPFWPFCFLPPLLPLSFTPASFIPPASLPRSLPMLSPASLTACLTFLPLLLTPSPWLIYSPTTLSASLTPLLHSFYLIHSTALLCLTCSLLTLLPPSFSFSSLSHCLTFPSLTHSCLTLYLNHSLLHSLPPFPASFTPPHSPPDSFTPQTSHSASLTLPHSLLFLTPSLPQSISFTPLHHYLPHPIPSHSPAYLIHIFVTQSLPHSALPNSFLPVYSFHHSLSHSLLASLSLPQSLCCLTLPHYNSLLYLLLAALTP